MKPALFPLQSRRISLVELPPLCDARNVHFRTFLSSMQRDRMSMEIMEEVENEF